VYLNGLMVEGLKEVGRKTNCTAVEFTPGLMVVATMESILRIKNKDLVYISGQTEKSMKGIGRMVSNMVKVNLQTSKVNRELASGKTAKDYVGCRAKLRKYSK